MIKAPAYHTIDEYIQLFPAQVQLILQELRQVIHSAAPQAQEAIAYGIPTFKLNGNLVHFGAFKDHISFFPGGGEAIEAFKDKLTTYKLAKGTIQMPLDKPLPVQLIQDMVAYRVQMNLKRKS